MAEPGTHERWSSEFGQIERLMTPEERERAEREREALLVYRATGDPSLAIEIGLFPEDTPHKEV